MEKNWILNSEEFDKAMSKPVPDVATACKALKGTGDSFCAMKPGDIKKESCADWFTKRCEEFPKIVEEDCPENVKAIDNYMRKEGPNFETQCAPVPPELPATA